MAGVLLPFLKWFIGGSASKGPKVLNCLVRSPWSTVDVIGEVRRYKVAEALAFTGGLLCLCVSRCYTLHAQSGDSIPGWQFSITVATILEFLLSH